MRILFLAPRSHGETGGIQAFSRRVCRALLELESSNDAITSVQFIFGHKFIDALPSAVALHTVPRKRNAVADTFCVAKAIIAADVVLYAHINLARVCLLVSLLNPGARQYLFLHGVEAWGDSTFRRPKFLESAALRFCIARFLSVSRYTAQKASDAHAIPINRFTIFPNAVDFAMQPTQMYKEIRPSYGEFKIICVSRMGIHDSDKRIDSLIAAVDLLGAAGVNVRLRVVGDGILREPLESKARALQSATRIEFMGQLSAQDLDLLYQEADVFVLPSLKEGFGIVYLEAWSYRLPVIGGNKAGAAEVISHNIDGFVTDPDNPAELAIFLETLRNDRELGRNMGNNGWRNVQQNYSHESFRSRLLGILISNP